MNMFKAFLLWLAVLVVARHPLQAQTPVRITANSVNLRAKAQLTSEVLAQANYDDQLVAHEIGEEWVEVAAPPTVDLWVMKSFIQMPQNTIGANRVNLRAGPSINYNIVDTLSLGDPVEPRGEELQDWIKIAPPASVRVWVSRQFVEVLSETSAEETDAGSRNRNGSSLGHRDSSAIRSPGHRIPPCPRLSFLPPSPLRIPLDAKSPCPPPADLKLIPLEGQGRHTEVEGSCAPRRSSTKPPPDTGLSAGKTTAGRFYAMSTERPPSSAACRTSAST